MGFNLFARTREEHEENAKWFAKTNIEELNKEEVGRYILCKSEDKTTSRMFINRFSTFSPELKDGWWDTFTLSSKPLEHAGFYICKIDQFKIDKNGFLMMIVTPEKYLDVVNEESTAWKYFTMSDCFTRTYDFSKFIHPKRFNISYLHGRYASDVVLDDTVGYMKQYAKLILDKLFNGEISIRDIEIALDERTEIEKVAIDLNSNISSYAEKYPLLARKLPKERTIFENAEYTTENTIKYLGLNLYSYNNLNLNTAASDDILDKVEAVLQHWEGKKEREKAERKQRRKEKKANRV